MVFLRKKGIKVKRFPFPHYLFLKWEEGVYVIVTIKSNDADPSQKFKLINLLAKIKSFG